MQVQPPLSQTGLSAETSLAEQDGCVLLQLWARCSVHPVEANAALLACLSVLCRPSPSHAHTYTQLHHNNGKPGKYKWIRRIRKNKYFDKCMLLNYNHLCNEVSIELNLKNYLYLMMEADMFSGVIIGSWRLKDADYKWGRAFSPRGLLTCGTSCRSMSWSLLPLSCSRKDWMIGAWMWNHKLCLHPLPVTSYMLTAVQLKFHTITASQRRISFLSLASCSCNSKFWLTFMIFGTKMLYMTDNTDLLTGSLSSLLVSSVCSSST